MNVFDILQIILWANSFMDKQFYDHTAILWIKQLSTLMWKSEWVACKNELSFGSFICDIVQMISFLNCRK